MFRLDLGGWCRFRLELGGWCQFRERCRFRSRLSCPPGLDHLGGLHSRIGRKDRVVSGELPPRPLGYIALWRRDRSGLHDLRFNGVIDDDPTTRRAQPLTMLAAEELPKIIDR